MEKEVLQPRPVPKEQQAAAFEAARQLSNDQLVADEMARVSEMESGHDKRKDAEDSSEGVPSESRISIDVALILDEIRQQREVYRDALALLERIASALEVNQ